MRALPTELGDAALMSPGPDGAAARAAAAAVIPAVKGPEFYSLGLVLGYGYGPDTAAQAPSTGVYEPRVAAGNRLPHSRSADGRSLFDLLGREFTVLGAVAAAQPLVDTAAQLGVPVAHADPQAHGFAPVAGHDVVLVRPDQHIAWVGDPSADPRMIIDVAVRGFAPLTSTI
jgi:hypothetical protein